jgi:hypothetical protein
VTLRGVARVGLAAAAFLFGASLPAVSAYAQPSVEVHGGDASEVAVSGDGGATHQGSGLVFPKQIGDMPLRGLTVYGPSDASAFYTLGGAANGDAWITFYVYPATITIAEEVEGIEQAMFQRLDGRRLKAPPAAPESLRPGRSAWFEGKYQDIDATTGYMLVQRGDWFLKARFTAPKEGGSVALDRMVKALSTVPWGWQPTVSKTQGAVVAAR